MNLKLEAVTVGHGGDGSVAIDQIHLGGELQIFGGHFGGTGHHEAADLQL